MKRWLVLLATHAIAVAIGFAAGIYVLPILIAPPAPTAAEVESAMGQAQYRTAFRRDLTGSDALHWGEGEVTISRGAIALKGRLAPGPDYKLYLVPQYVDTEEAFRQVKSKSARVGDVKTFENFVVPVPDSIDVANYDTVLVWCESFSQFITSAKYR